MYKSWHAWLKTHLQRLFHDFWLVSASWIHFKSWKQNQICTQSKQSLQTFCLWQLFVISNLVHCYIRISGPWMGMWGCIGLDASQGLTPNYLPLTSSETANCNPNANSIWCHLISIMNCCPTKSINGTFKIV